MDKYASRVRDAEENRDFLEEHPELLHEHCMGTRPARPTPPARAKARRTERSIYALQATC